MIQISAANFNSMQTAAPKCKWMQKKEDIGKKKDMTAAERELEMYKRQAYDIREGNKKYELTAKLENGTNLTSEELDYLRKNEPEKLREYEESRKEAASYEKQLDQCETKEEVEEVHMNKLNSYLAQAKDISNNPYIPKGKKLEMLAKLVKKTEEVEKIHVEFTSSLKYQMLPEDEEEKKAGVTGEAEKKEKKNEPDSCFSGDVGMTIGEETLRRLTELRDGVQKDRHSEGKTKEAAGTETLESEKEIKAMGAQKVIETVQSGNTGKTAKSAMIDVYL